jgi:hypothetical protein
MRKTKIVYSFTDDGEFNGTDVAYESWELNDVYLLPANTTEISPPEFNISTHKAVWQNTIWSVQELETNDSELSSTCSAPEINWNSIRDQIQHRLDASDWTMMSDVNLVNKEAWITYRQALRDIPQKYQDPAAIIWPVAP